MAHFPNPMQLEPLCIQTKGMTNWAQETRVPGLLVAIRQQWHSVTVGWQISRESSDLAGGCEELGSCSSVH